MESHLSTLSKLFSEHLSQFSLTDPNDILDNSARAMLPLSDGGQTNLLYNLSKGMGTLPPDHSDSRLFIKQIPLGLIKYIAQFLLAIIYSMYIRTTIESALCLMWNIFVNSSYCKILELKIY